MGIMDTFKARQAYRMSICESCEHFQQKNKSCMLCGCYMEVKTWVPIFKCPKNKWD